MTAFGEAAGYDAWYETPVGRLTDILEKDAVFSLIKDPPGLALDLSCGTGNYAFELARRGWRVIGVDRSLPMLRRARAKLGSRPGGPAFVAGDAAALPLRGASVPLVTLILGLEFMADRVQTLREVRRVLRPGGTAVVAILPRGGLWNFWRRLKRRFAPSVWRHARFLSTRDFVSALPAAGFLITDRRAAVHYPPLVHSASWLLRWERFAAAHGVRCAASFLAVRLEAEPESVAAHPESERLENR
jgi:ubiquinone/menaquinone biosynthesis C-methylase UbiE